MKKNLNIAYLNGAEGMIRRGVASSGGSDSGESSWRYFDMSKLKGVAGALTMYFAAIIKTTVSDTYGKPLFLSAGTIMGGGTQGVGPTQLIAVPTNIPMTYEGGEVATFEEGCIKYDVTDEELAVGEITKEQFYSLE